MNDLLNERIFRKILRNNCLFTKQTILLNKRFYYTNDFTKRSFSEETKEIKGKINENFKNERTQFFLTIKKTNAPISSRRWFPVCNIKINEYVFVRKEVAALVLVASLVLNSSLKGTVSVISKGAS